MEQGQITALEANFDHHKKLNLRFHIDFIIILCLYKAQGQGQIPPEDNISMLLIQSFCYFDHLVKFHHETPNSKEIKAKTHFFVC